MGSIHFFSEDVSFTIKNPRKNASWIKSVASKEGKSIKELNYIFCSDRFLLSLNKNYLNHDTLTDIITFNLSPDLNSPLQGEIYISVERVEENALKFNSDFNRELRRVIIHGVLHLIGYGDKKKAEKVLMREKEEAYISL